MEIAPGIHMIGSTVGGRPLQLYLLHGDERTVLIDSGSASDPENAIFPYLARLGLGPADLDLVINTHSDFDHIGGNLALKRANPGLLVTCGEADRELIQDPNVIYKRRYNAYEARHGIAYDSPTHESIMENLGGSQLVDFTWVGGETLMLAPDWRVEIHHTPGHSPGHLSVFDPRSRMVLTGDAVHGAVYLDTEGNPALCPTYTDVDAYLNTVKYLRYIGAHSLAGSHWPIKHGAQVGAFLDETEQFVHLADRLIKDELSRRPKGATLLEIISAVGPKLGDWPRPVDLELAYALDGHMNRLVEQGRVKEDISHKPVRYSLVR